MESRQCICRYMQRIDWIVSNRQYIIKVELVERGLIGIVVASKTIEHWSIIKTMENIQPIFEWKDILLLSRC